MYTLRLESIDRKNYNDFLRMLQAFIQEKKLWSYEIEGPRYQDFSMTITLSTPSIREMKRLVDLLESEEFMRDCDG